MEDGRNDDALVLGKRLRDNSDESPESKRIRADILLLLEDDSTENSVNPEIDSVIQSLQEEISPPQPDICYLLGASDDELGLPPSTVAEDSDKDVSGLDVLKVQTDDFDGYGNMWGVGDDISDYESFELPITVTKENEDESGFVIEDLFGYSEYHVPSSDFNWWPESLPAV